MSMIVSPIKTRIFKLNESLEKFIAEHLPKVSNRSVIVVASKIVALSQGRRKFSKEKTKWVKRESERFIKTRWGYLTLKDGHWCYNSGIDESNAEGGGLILWPREPYHAARELRRKLLKFYRIKELGILITDSRIFPLRSGVCGVALGYAGFAGLKDYIGKKDLFGQKLKMTRTNVADCLASAAVLVMGEGAEAQPLAVVSGMALEFRANTDTTELAIDAKDDLYKPLFSL